MSGTADLWNLTFAGGSGGGNSEKPEGCGLPVINLKKWAAEGGGQLVEVDKPEGCGQPVVAADVSKDECTWSQMGQESKQLECKADVVSWEADADAPALVGYKITGEVKRSEYTIS